MLLCLTAGFELGGMPDEESIRQLGLRVTGKDEAGKGQKKCPGLTGSILSYQSKRGLLGSRLFRAKAFPLYTTNWRLVFGEENSSIWRSCYETIWRNRDQ